MESHKAGFPPFPLLLEIPAGFPHSPPLRRRFYLLKRHRKGLVMDVSGPQRNACPGTLKASPATPSHDGVKHQNLKPLIMTTAMLTIQPPHVGP